MPIILSFGCVPRVAFTSMKRHRMRIQIDPHTLERTEERGTNEEEIKDVINTGFPGKWEGGDADPV